MRYMIYIFIWHGIADTGIRDILYTYAVQIYMVFNTAQFCISFEKCSIILNLFLLTYGYIYNVTYNRYMQLLYHRWRH